MTKVPPISETLRELATQTLDGVELRSGETVTEIAAVDLLSVIDDARKAVRHHDFAAQHVARLLAAIVAQKRRGLPVSIDRRAYMVLTFYAKGNVVGGAVE